MTPPSGPMKSKLFALCIALMCLMSVSFTFAQDSVPTKPVEVSDSQSSNKAFSEALEKFQPLVGIPGIDKTSVTELGFGDYINALYRLSISIAALLAVIKIIAAGVKYMFSDIVTQKADAKKDIQGALVGLLIIIGAVIILNTVNTDITKNQILMEPTGADGTDNGILDSVNANLIGKLNNALEVCNKKFKTTCELIKSVSEEECKTIYDGNFVPGSYINTFGSVTNEGNFANYCYHDPRVLACRNDRGTWNQATLKCEKIIPGVKSCPIGQIISVITNDDGLSQICVPAPAQDPLPEGVKTMSLAYICANPTGCNAVLGGWSKDGAYRICDEKNGQLDDDPARPGYGICMYEE